jgi:elongator complex protein 1
MDEFIVGDITYLLTLSSNSQLVLNNTILSNECTSFTIFKHFVAFTGNTPDLFHFVYVIDLLKEIKIDRKSLYCRNIERGSRLLAIPSHDKMVVQAPRGNLEVIAHRILTLYQAYELHGLRRYKQCHEVLRKNKLDMNLLFDFNPF